MNRPIKKNLRPTTHIRAYADTHIMLRQLARLKEQTLLTVLHNAVKDALEKAEKGEGANGR